MAITTLNIGILGFGFMGKMHTFGYRTLPLYYKDLPVRIRLIGACTAHSDIEALAVDQLGFEYVARDPARILGDPDINVVDICTPNGLHYEQVRAALAAGKNVYCDKPLATTAADALALARLADEAGVTAQVCLNYRFLTATQRARQLMEEGFLGDITCFSCAYRHSGSVDAARPIGWKQDAAQGGGVLFDLGSHALDLMYWLLGPYAAVQAVTRVLYPQRPTRDGGLVDVTAEDHVAVTATMANGAVGTIEATKIATGTNDELSFQIFGTRGAMAFNLMEPSWLQVFDNRVAEAPLGGLRGFTRVECVQRYPAPGGSFPSSKSAIGWERGHVHSLYTFVDNVVHGRPGSPSFNEGAYIQRVMEAVDQAAKLHREVRLDG